METLTKSFGWPDVTNKNRRCRVIFEFQVESKNIFGKYTHVIFGKNFHEKINLNQKKKKERNYTALHLINKVSKFWNISPD